MALLLFENRVGKFPRIGNFPTDERHLGQLRHQFDVLGVFPLGFDQLIVRERFLVGFLLLHTATVRLEELFDVLTIAFFKIGF